MARIYLASSWRNPQQPDVVVALRMAGHEVYDFRNPDVQGPPGGRGRGFGWGEIDPMWQTWTPEQFRDALEHETADAGFWSDANAMEWADTFVLLQPCGRSAHLELGWACGRPDKTTIVLLAPRQEPELMLKFADHICLDLDEVIQVLTENEWQHTIVGAEARPDDTEADPADAPALHGIGAPEGGIDDEDDEPASEEAEGDIPEQQYTATLRLTFPFRLIDLSLVGSAPGAPLEVWHGGFLLYDHRVDGYPVEGQPGFWSDLVRKKRPPELRPGDDLRVTVRTRTGSTVKVSAFGWKPKPPHEGPPSEQAVEAVREVFDSAIDETCGMLKKVYNRDVKPDEAISALLAFLMLNLEVPAGTPRAEHLRGMVDHVTAELDA